MLNYTVKNIIASGEIPLILLHGFLESSTMWGHLGIPIGYPIVTIDLPGHGKSKDQVSSCSSMEEMAKEVIAVIDELELTNYHLIGHSMGGYVGLELMRLDSRLDKVMLLNSNFWSDSPQKVRDRNRVAEIVLTNKSHFIYEVIPNLFLSPEDFDVNVKELIAEALEMSSVAISKISLAMSRRKDFSDFVNENSGGLTIIQGFEDPIVPVGQMRELLQGTRVNYEELKNVGHMAHFENRERVNSIIEQFLL